MPSPSAPSKSSAAIRKEFLQFFADRGHTVVPSAPVIPYDDPTLLFTNAGMNQFKDVFLGTGTRPYRRAADTQKCIRVSGKHNDLEEVGRDTYHHTFFEMLGNWSFGDYYKREAIGWAWELLTAVWGLPKERLYATVYESDDEAEGLWRSATGIDPSHILRFGKKENFWEMGETGPCGPCSEIHIDRTPDGSGRGLVNRGDSRVIEIWNLVFIQYDRTAAGELLPLPAKHVDTGMGFERICAVLQGKGSNYDTDIFMPIIGEVAKAAGKSYGGGDADDETAMRVIADHLRMLSFSIADGALPSNEGRGYVMRRILRRAARFGRALGMREPFLHGLVGAVVSSMGTEFPELAERRGQIERVIRGEEESFNATLDRGLEIFETAVKALGASRVLPGGDAFRLYDTYGFPLDLTAQMAAERGLTVDTAGFEALMEEQRGRARQARSSAGGSGSSLRGGGRAPTRFLGYERTEAVSEIVEFFTGDDGERYLLAAESPFYAESGGQISDTGIAVVDGVAVPVTGIVKAGGGAIAHRLGRSGARIEPGMPVTLRVDARRRGDIARNHSATHLVHEALRRVLGTHLRQHGSLVAADHLRFDFNHFEKITPDQLRAIEEIVNEKIADDIRVAALNDPGDWLTIDEAKAKFPNVKMFFGEKYGERVRVVEIDPSFSVELCGGTHVAATGDLGLFKITAESGIASGIRRIEAVTGEGLAAYIEKLRSGAAALDREIDSLLAAREDLERQLGRQPSARPHLPPPAGGEGASGMAAIALAEGALGARKAFIEDAGRAAAELRKELSGRRVREGLSEIDAIVGRAVACDGFRVAAARVEAGNADELKSLADALRSKLASGVGVLAAVIDGKVQLVCVVTDDVIAGKKLAAGRIVGELAKRVGGGGGGKPHLATAGGRDVAALDGALAATAAIVATMLPGGAREGGA